MSSPSVALLGAVFTALKANSDLTSILSQRVYDRNPTVSPTFPYITVDYTSAEEDDDECGKHWDCTVTVHAWSRQSTTLECRTILGHIRAALDAVTSVTGYSVNYQQFRQERCMDDPDGVTTHGVVIYTYNIAEV